MPVLNYKDINVCYQDTGKGTSLVLLHGFLENLSMWNCLKDSMEGNYRLICIDLLGHGKTQNLGYIHKMEDHSEMVKRTIDHLDIGKVKLVGHSMGGYVALAFAEKYPEMVGGICLLNSTPLPDSPDKKLNRERAISAVKENHQLFVRMAIPNLFAESNRTKFKKDIDLVIQQALTIGPQGIIASLEGMKIRDDRRNVIEQFKRSSKIILGKQDTVLDHDEQILVAKSMGINFVSCAGGHMSLIENKQEVINELISFGSGISM